jgi:hypothetical protein
MEISLRNKQTENEKLKKRVTEHLEKIHEDGKLIQHYQEQLEEMKESLEEAMHLFDTYGVPYPRP